MNAIPIAEHLMSSWFCSCVRLTFCPLALLFLALLFVALPITSLASLGTITVGPAPGTFAELGFTQQLETLATRAMTQLELELDIIGDHAAQISELLDGQAGPSRVLHQDLHNLAMTAMRREVKGSGDSIIENLANSRLALLQQTPHYINTPLLTSEMERCGSIIGLLINSRLALLQQTPCYINMSILTSEMERCESIIGLLINSRLALLQ